MTVSSTVGPCCVLAFRVNNVLAQRDVIPDWKLPVGSVGRHDDADDEEREVEQGERVEEVETHCGCVQCSILFCKFKNQEIRVDQNF